MGYPFKDRHHLPLVLLKLVLVVTFNMIMSLKDPIYLASREFAPLSRTTQASWVSLFSFNIKYNQFYILFSGIFSYVEKPGLYRLVFALVIKFPFYSFFVVNNLWILKSRKDPMCTLLIGLIHPCVTESKFLRETFLKLNIGKRS